MYVLQRWRERVSEYSRWSCPYLYLYVCVCVCVWEQSRRWACPVKTAAQLGKKREWVEEQCSELQCAIIVRGMKLQGWYLWDPRVWCTDSPGALLGLSSHTPYCPAIINNQRSSAPTLQELWPYLHQQLRFCQRRSCHRWRECACWCF